MGFLPLLVGAVSLIGSEGLLAVLGGDGLVPVSGAGDLANYLILQGGAAGNRALAEPLNPLRNVRIKAAGSGSRGDTLILATGEGDAGMVSALDDETGVLFSPGIAEEDFVDGQLVLVRPLPRYLTVEGEPVEFVAAAPAGTAATSDAPFGYSEAQANALLQNVIEIRAALIAKGIMSPAV